MALKDTWVDKKNTTDGNDGDYIVAEDINAIAKAVIDLEEGNGNKEFYTKAEIDEFLSEKRDVNNFVPVAAASLGELETNISLVGITSVTEQSAESHPSITDSSVAAEGAEAATFKITYKGAASITIISTHAISTESFAEGKIFVDGNELDGVNHTPINEQWYTEYIYNGEINRGITIKSGAYSKFTFTTFDGQRYVYSDGFMSGEQAERLDNLETKIGDIDSALDELHGYAASLIGGGA